MSRQARHLTVHGRVQGVGYRPFVYRLARDLGLTGWVKNAAGVVEIHAEGDPAQLDAFARDLVRRAPAIARPEPPRQADAVLEDCAGFGIRPSDADETPDIHVPPDYFACPDCLAEMRDPADRRFGYPFINCTQCGPRYTLIEALPYDRPSTAMKGFPLCPACRAEYEDPGNRRFHAEPVACPVCGPHLALHHPGQPPLSGDTAVLAKAAVLLRAGRILAVKGVGGYHLMCDAGNAAAVAALRARKPRPGKPLAVMFGEDGARLAEAVRLDPASEAFLRAPARPILLLPLKDDPALSRELAPGLNELGVFLPYSPLHHLLLETFGSPLVATSANLSGEPVLTEGDTVETRLAHVADAFLHHDRPIVRPADDPVYRIIAGRPRPLRLGRGTTPQERRLPRPLDKPVLALGAHTKNTLTLAWDDRAVVSPHIGDLGSARSLDTLRRVADDLQRLYQVQARGLLLDRHPGYGYRRWARESGLPWHEIPHHAAHASALAGEFPEVADWIVFAWDGVGLGEDGTLWGGEALLGGPGRWRRAASWRPFRPPGGEKAGRDPWRSAAALLWELGQPAPFAPDLAHQAWRKGLNCPVTSAVGRLFDAAAALVGVCREASFEGEGPMRLEALAGDLECPPLPLPLGESDGLWRTDWAPLVPALLDSGRSPAERAALFHASLARALVDQARHLAHRHGIRDVGLTGGVFQNRRLTELAHAGLAAAGLRVHLAADVPVNDAGVSFGQVIEYLHSREPAGLEASK